MAHEFQRAEGASRGNPVVSPPVDAADISTDMPGVSAVQRRTPFLRYALYVLLVILLGMGALYGWYLWKYYQIHESTDDAYVVGHVVPVSPQVNGTVLAVHIADHQAVEADQGLRSWRRPASSAPVRCKSS
jgi:hypothetical protein